MNPDDPSPQTGSLSRWLPLLMLMVATAHFNRLSITVAGAEAIIGKEGISETEMGWVYSAYLLFYTLAMSPGGWFIDRFGARLAMFVLGVGSALFVCMVGFAGMWLTGPPLLLALLATRSFMGIVNAPTHPASARLVGDGIRPARRGLVNGMVTFAACIGMTLTYPVFGALKDRFGWPAAFQITSGCTLILAACWGAFTLRGFEHAAQASVSNHLLAPRARKKSQPLRGGRMLLANRSLLMLTLSYAAVNYFQYLFFYWSEYYFETAQRMSTEDSRLFSSVLTLSMGVGMMFGGFATDWTRMRIRHPRSVGLVPVCGLLGSGMLLLPAFVSDDPSVIVTFFALAMAAIGTCEGAFWTLAVELGGKRGGLAAGILNTGGNAGGLLAPLLTPYLKETSLGWSMVIVTAMSVSFFGALCWIWIDPHERMEGRQAKQRC